MCKQKFLSVAMIGKPNAGKSTLLNYLVKHKISIVTHKVQTTRTIIPGILTLEDTQLLFFDTPGILDPKSTIEKSMIRCIWSSINDADIILLIFDSTTKVDVLITNLLYKLLALDKPIIVVFNKSDLYSQYLQDNICYFSNYFNNNEHIFSVSAITGQGIEKLLYFFRNNAPESAWLYDKEEITNLPSYFLAAEITREELYLQLHQELPYQLVVQNEYWEKLKNGSIKIRQIIIVSRKSYKTIIIGKNGQKIKEIGIRSRQKIAQLMQTKIHLFLFVKIKVDWQKNLKLYSI